MIALLLWLLATLDTAFIGYREAAGRNALIGKRRYYRRAMFRGAVFGQVVVALVGVLIAIAILCSADPTSLIDDLQKAGSRMLFVYVPFALVILITFAIRAVPSVDLRSITSVVIFGPFTLARPFVAAAGVIWGIYSAPRPTVLVIGAVILFLMLTLERMIGMLRRRGLVT